MNHSNAAELQRGLRSPHATNRSLSPHGRGGGRSWRDRTWPEEPSRRDEHEPQTYRTDDEDPQQQGKYVLYRPS